MVSKLLAGIAMWLAASSAFGSVVPVTSALIEGNYFDFMAALLDAQPVSDPVAGSTTSNVGAILANDFSVPPPTIGIDFGTNFSTKTFTDVFILQGGWSSATANMEYYWSTDAVYDSGVDLRAPNIGLFNYIAAGTDPLGRWDLEYHNAEGVTPSARFLIGKLLWGNTGTYNCEVAFVNVPEPATLGLVVLSLGFLGARRRSSHR